MKKTIALVCAALTAAAFPFSVYAAAHDLDGNGQFNRNDCAVLTDYLLTNRRDIASQEADRDADYCLTAKDLTLMKREILRGGQQNPNPQNPEVHVNASEYMEKVRSSFVLDVPQDILNAKGGELQHITYFSTKANKEKGAFIWTPPGYDPAQQYPVFYVNHGIQGSEYSMLGDFKILESAAGLIQKGEAVPMLIVFTFMYTNPDRDNCAGITADEEPFYDAFLGDLTECLMPYIAEHYPVKSGRENTAIGGFSMGGRESLYIGVSRPDLFGYIAATSPAPGVTPATDQFFEHPGSMPEDKFRIDPPYEPYLLMIAGGTDDGMVHVAPGNYSKLLTKNGTDHIYVSIQGGGHDGKTGIPLFYNFIRALFKA